MSGARGVRVALETSSRSPTVAARTDERALESPLGQRPHASDLLPALDALLRELGASPRAVDAVLVGTGPGSYTGLRVGVATALGIARGSGAALFGVPSGEVLAWRELAPGEEALHLLDARAGELYLARYRRTEGEVEVLLAPRVVQPAELAPFLDGPVRVLADPAAAREAGLAPDDPRLTLDPVPRAAALLALGLPRLARHGPQAPAQVEPLYLRAFAAKTRRR